MGTICPKLTVLSSFLLWASNVLCWIPITAIAANLIQKWVKMGPRKSKVSSIGEKIDRLVELARGLRYTLAHCGCILWQQPICQAVAHNTSKIWIFVHTQIITYTSFQYLHFNLCTHLLFAMKFKPCRGRQEPKSLSFVRKTKKATFQWTIPRWSGKYIVRLLHQKNRILEPNLLILFLWCGT